MDELRTPPVPEGPRTPPPCPPVPPGAKMPPSTPPASEEELASRVRGAYKSIAPSAEARERMQQVVLAAAKDAKRGGARRAGTLPNRDVNRRFFATSIAACLVVAAGTGALAIALSAAQPNGLASITGDESAAAVGSSAVPEEDAVIDESAEGSLDVSESASSPSDSEESLSDAAAVDDADAPADSTESADGWAPVTVKLSTGETMRVVAAGGAEPMRADESRVGELLDKAQALGADGTVRACEIYRYDDAERPYVMRCDGMEGYCFVEPDLEVNAEE